MTESIEATVHRLADEFAGALSPSSIADFEALHPADQVTVLRQLDGRHRIELAERLDDGRLALVLGEMDAEDRGLVADHLSSRRLSAVLDRASPDTAADLLRQLDQPARNAVLNDMATAAAVRPLLGHEDDTAGGIMLPNVVALPGAASVGSALQFLRDSQPDPESVYYVYLVDPDQKLLGVVGLRSIVTAQPSTRLADIMDPQLVSVPLGTDQEQCARLLQRYKLIALPVVDERGRLVGSITADDVIDIAEEEATEDMFRLVGIDEDERTTGPLRRSVRRRLPWLLINIVTALLASAVVGLFEPAIAQVALLAVFMPIVAGMGGNATAQTVTLVVRGLALGEIEPSDSWRLLAREAALGSVHGLVLGSITGALAFAWKGDGWIGAILAAAILLNLVTAALAGAAVPFGLKLLRIDPALASTVIVTTITDIAGFFFFLGLATLLLIELT